MTDYKLVPVEPTAEMVFALKSRLLTTSRGGILNAGHALADAISAAPAVQGEPSLVAWVLYDATADKKYIKASDDGSLAIFESEAAARRAKFLHPGTDYKRCEYYSAPKPAEHLNIPVFARRMDEELGKHDISGFEPVILAVAEEVLGIEPTSPTTFRLGDLVRKIKGSQWKGRVVGTYSTELTPEGYAVESDTEKGSVQIYPAAALEMVGCVSLEAEQQPECGCCGQTDRCDDDCDAVDQQPAPDVSESKAATPKESWWAGYRAGKGLSANTPRQDAIAAPDVADYEQVLDDHRRLTRELDVLLNGEEGAAKQASLADMVAQLRTVVRNTGKPVLAAPDVSQLVEALETALFGTPLDDVSNRDNDDIWCLCYPHLPERASDALRDYLVRIETALAAHLKQGGDS